MDFANEDRHMWFQFALTLICDNRFVRAIRTLDHCASLNSTEKNININNNGSNNRQSNGELFENAQNFDSKAIIEQMLATRIYLEQLDNPSEGCYYIFL